MAWLGLILCCFASSWCEAFFLAFYFSSLNKVNPVFANSNWLSRAVLRDQRQLNVLLGLSILTAPILVVVYCFKFQSIHVLYRKWDSLTDYYLMTLAQPSNIITNIAWSPTRFGLLSTIARDSSVVQLYDIQHAQLGMSYSWLSIKNSSIFTHKSFAIETPEHTKITILWYMVCGIYVGCYVLLCCTLPFQVCTSCFSFSLGPMTIHVVVVF